MTININWKTVLMVAGAVATVYAAYKLAKEEKEEKERLDAHKDEELAGRDLEEEALNASVNNPVLSGEALEKAEAYTILSRYKAAVDNAKTIAEFDEALKTFDDATADLYSENHAAFVLIHKEKLAKMDRELISKHEDEKERRRNQAERDKGLIIANAIKKINKEVNGNDTTYRKVKVWSC